MKTKTLNKLNLVVIILLILLGTATGCIAFIPAVIQQLFAWFGPPAYLVFPNLLAVFSALLFFKNFYIDRKRGKKP